MLSEGFAVEQHRIHVMETCTDEPCNEAGLAWAGSGLGSVYGISRLRKQPSSPFRSIGGYLDYAGWPDCQRFMELDRAIQLDADESRNTDSGADSDDSLEVRPVERYPETLDHGYRPRRGFCLPVPCANTKAAEQCAGPSLADVIRGLEALPFRRL
jgi:hypothetical protein